MPFLGKGYPQLFAVSTPIAAPDTRDIRCIKQAKEWLNGCLKNHERCTRFAGLSGRKVYQARLIDISKPRLRLVRRDQIHQNWGLQYMTVSHRWCQPGDDVGNAKGGSADITPKLFSNDLESKTLEFDIRSLPQLFQQCISLARELNIRYVWIDSFCVIQDDKSDLELELEMGNMGHIYQNAILNVGSLQRTDGTVNTPVELFGKREPRRYSPFAVTIKRKDYTQICFAYLDEDVEEINKTDIMCRGWVLQERLLSPRSIYFGAQLHWECSESIACEVFPQRNPARRDAMPFGVSTPLRISTLLEAKEKHRFSDDSQVLHSEVDYRYQCWLDIVQRYAQYGLSYDSDCFPALSGLAHTFQEALQRDQYHAGLWSGDMLHGLLWYADEDVEDLMTDYVRPEVYKAPTWSWAFAIVPATFLSNDHDWRREENITFPIETQYQDEIDLAPKRGWRVSLSLETCEVFDYGYLESGYQLPLRYYDGDVRDVGHVYGLMIEIVDAETEAYQRIGSFAHLRGDLRTKDEITDPEEYPEFIDLDPYNFERRTITII
ncbi:hypothetical protein CC86DRAFT_423210 [Ophiobolus disseminans]|uniref:Heterokaryon incompatibility domain-containing protein n=1 Tax=Ophiobolus disseminans TaxID=1469910 RepID=A0A6A6ZRK6_9PLEO|nr:hypothetical protein CC86DRAFT_423210 [Ophiobolus disseminans]